jgi:hypothetical protein
MRDEVKRRLEAYYEEQEALLRKEKEEKKKKNLIERGLYRLEEKEIKNNISGETFQEEVKVALEVTDEEYEKILMYDHNKNTKETKVTNLQLAFRVLGNLTFLIGFLVGLIMADENFLIMLVIWVIASVVGMLYLALAKGLDLLEEINRNTK